MNIAGGRIESASGVYVTDHEQIWARTSALLREKVSESTFQLWLEPLRPRSLQDDRMVVEVSEELKSWVQKRFADLLEATITQAAGREVALDLRSMGGKAVDLPSGQDQDGGTAVDRDWTTRVNGLNPKFAFDQFVIGESNRLAHAAALSVAEMPAQAYNPLFIYGAPGVGKTHLLHAIGNLAREHGDCHRVMYATAEEFTNSFTQSIRTGDMDRFKARYRGVDMLLIDDIQFLESKARTEEEFFHTFNAIHDTGAQVVISSDRTPDDLSRMEQRLTERFGSGLVVKVEPPELSTKTSILAMRARRDGLGKVPSDALEVIAGSIIGNVRMLEGALIRVVAYASLTSSEITADLASQVLKQLYPENAVRSNPTSDPEAIKAMVAEAYGVSKEQLESGSRSAGILWPRQVAMYLAREHANQPLPRIGKAFGGRNHSTVINSCRKVEKRMANDPKEALRIQTLARQISGDDRTT